MDQETMVARELDKQLIAAGEELLKRLDEVGVKPDAAFWFYFPDLNTWKLVLAEVKVGRNGPKEIYRSIQKVLGKLEAKPTGFSLDDIALTTPDSPLVKVLRVALHTGPGISGIRFRNNVINGTLIEDAYIYRVN